MKIKILILLMIAGLSASAQWKNANPYGKQINVVGGDTLVRDVTNTSGQFIYSPTNKSARYTVGYGLSLVGQQFSVDTSLIASQWYVNNLIRKNAENLSKIQQKIRSYEAITASAEGTSLTYGQGGDGAGTPINGSSNTRDSRPWPETMAFTLTDLGYSITMINRGYPGDRTIEGLTRWEGASPVDINYIEYAHNDANNYGGYPSGVVPVSVYRANLLKIIDRSINKGNYTVLIKMPLPKDVQQAYFVGKYQEVMMSIAKTLNIDVVDMAQSAQIIYDQMVDGVHFTHQTYGQIGSQASISILKPFGKNAIEVFPGIKFNAKNFPLDVYGGSYDKSQSNSGVITSNPDGLFVYIQPNRKYYLALNVKERTQIYVKSISLDGVKGGVFRYGDGGVYSDESATAPGNSGVPTRTNIFTLNPGYQIITVTPYLNQNSYFDEIGFIKPDSVMDVNVNKITANYGVFKSASFYTATGEKQVKFINSASETSLYGNSGSFGFNNSVDGGIWVYTYGSSTINQISTKINGNLQVTGKTTIDSPPTGDNDAIRKIDLNNYVTTNTAQTITGNKDITGAQLLVATQPANDSSTKAASTAYADRAASNQLQNSLTPSSTTLAPSVDAVNTGLNTSAKWKGENLAVTSKAIGDFIWWNGSNWINRQILATAPLNWNSSTGTMSINDSGYAKLSGGNSFSGVQNLTNGSVQPLSGFSDSGFINTLQSNTLGTNVTTFLPTNGGVLATLNDLSQTVSVSGTSQALSSNRVYIPHSASLTTFTLPAMATEGQLFQIVGEGAGGWRISQNASQQIVGVNVATTSGTSGSVQSTNPNCTITIRCTVTNSKFTITSSQGTLTIN